MTLVPADVAALGAQAERMLTELAAISAEPDRIVRLFLTPEHRRAADLVAQWMREAGLSVSEDALGTVKGRWPGERDQLLLIGSHIDTVIDAGKYDGVLGVVAGILAAGHFAQAGRRLPFGIEVLAFGDEEGSRFPVTLSSSAACAGLFDDPILSVTDRNGISYAEAVKAYGKLLPPIRLAAYTRTEALAYVELHIEQGPVLEAKGQPLGVVTAIVGQNRLRVTVTGQASHAGTVPMDMRRDALAGTAEMIAMIEKTALAHFADRMVATVGQIEAAPGATNIIPGRVTFSIDLRSADDARRREALVKIEQEARRIAAARGLEVSFEPQFDTAHTPCAPHLQNAIERAILDLGHKPVRLVSGAGHDAQMMARLCPMAMVFVRCRGGISHNPAEFASEADIGAGIAALIRFIARLAAEPRA